MLYQLLYYDDVKDHAIVLGSSGIQISKLYRKLKQLRYVSHADTIYRYVCICLLFYFCSWGGLFQN